MGSGEKKKQAKKSGGIMKKMDFRWALRLVGITFVISIVLSMISSNLLEKVGFGIAFVVLFAFVLLGIVFDIVGIAMTAASEKPFHSMASRKVGGAEHALFLIRNNEKVSSFCNDVVGDIAGIISGATSAVIVVRLTQNFSLNAALTQLLFYGLVSGLMVGGKALGKSVALSHSTDIVYFVARIMGVYFSCIKKIKKVFRRNSDND